MLKKILPLLLLPLLLHARKAVVHPITQESKGPWFTGPLLTPSGHVIPFGHQNYEPYLYWFDLMGEYDNHWHFNSTPHFKTFESQTAWQFGIFPKAELDFISQFVYNNCKGKHFWRVADQPIAMAFQLLMDEPGGWYPAIKVRVGAVIPLGKYDRLNPKQFETDSAGLGNWAPSLGLTSIRTFHFGRDHFLAWRMNVNYTFTVPIPVHGLSLYGGAPSSQGVKGTRGTVYPGNILVIQQGFEYSFTLNWAVALDLMYQHNNRNRFSGHSPPGTKPVLPSAELFSIAPAVEYNFNENIGMIFGPWVTVAGRNDSNTDQFLAWVFAINVYH
ncbi:MAG: hypothetical protein JSS10_09365 [Verrucomicrobia bacterium]|nr:hypothetical protein [Verrucomicrobiota bacterium]